MLTDRRVIDPSEKLSALKKKTILLLKCYYQYYLKFFPSIHIQNRKFYMLILVKFNTNFPKLALFMICFSALCSS